MAAILLKYENPDSAAMASGSHPLPENGDYNRSKRELLRLGIQRGYLRASEIHRSLPAPHMTEAELEMLYFALEALGILVVEDEPRGP